MIPHPDSPASRSVSPACATSRGTNLMVWRWFGAAAHPLDQSGLSQIGTPKPLGALFLCLL
jgi:hypothetical protein